jgi:formate/nitrite transporter FocA (FNT family)
MQQSSQSRNNPVRSNPNDRGDRDRNDRHSPRGRGPGGSGGGRPPHRRHPRPSTNIAAEIIHNGSRRIGNASYLGLFILAILGGGLMALSAVFALQIAGAIENPIWQQVALTFGFTGGLFLVLASNSVLFTEANILVPANLYGVKVGTGFLRLFLFWILAWIGNYFGVFLTVWLLKLAGTQLTASATFVKAVTDQRLLLSPNGLMWGIVPLFVSGILANWVMGIATLFATYNRVAMGKIMCLLFGIAVITLANFQFFPINVALFAVAGMLDPTVNTWHVLINHLVPVSLGNLVGGAFLVSLPLLLQIRRAKPA